jgi:HEAT repeat protein
VSFEQHRALCPDFLLFTLAGLDAEQRNVYVNTFPAEYQNSYNPAALIDQLNRMPRLSALAANPLLLSVLCSVADDPSDIPFPATRGILYEKAIEKLVTRRPRRVEVRYPGEEPTRDEKIRILQRTALSLFTQSDHRLTFTGQELGQALKQALGEEGYGEASAPWANALRTDLAGNSGLLRGSAEHGFFFLHPTIQEFLVARALADAINEKGWETAIPTANKRVSTRHLIDRKAWDPRWQEVLLFLAGQIADPLPLLNLLANAKRDDLFGCRLALAALCLPEIPSVFDEKFSLIVEQVTARVVSHWTRYERENTTVAVMQLTQTFPALGQVNGRIESIPFLQWLCRQLHDTDKEARARAAELLGYIGEAIVQHPEVLAALMAALHDPEMFVRAEATEALRRIGAVAARHADIPAALIQVALHDPHVLIRTGAIKALAQMPEATIQHLDLPPSLSAALRDEQGNRHSQATRVPEQREPSVTLHSQNLSTLIAALQDHDGQSRAQAAHQLGNIWGIEVTGPQHAEVLSALVQAALYDKDVGVRAQATKALGQIGVAVTRHPEVLPALIAALGDRDKGVRSHAAKALGQMGKAAASYPEVLPALMAALRDQEGNVRYRAAEALGQVMAQGVRIFRRWWGKIEGKNVEELADL